MKDLKSINSSKPKRSNSKAELENKRLAHKMAKIKNKRLKEEEGKLENTYNKLEHLAR